MISRDSSETDIDEKTPILGSSPARKMENTYKTVAACDALHCTLRCFALHSGRNDKVKTFTSGCLLFQIHIAK